MDIIVNSNIVNIWYETFVLFLSIILVYNGLNQKMRRNAYLNLSKISNDSKENV